MTPEQLLKQELAKYEEDDGDWDIPQLDDSVYNPANDEFKRTKRIIEQHLTQIAMQMPSRHARIVKTYYRVGINKQVAEECKCSPQTVGRVIRSELGSKMLRLLRQYHGLMSGVSSIEREQFLWRVALNNEIMNPRTSIAAIAEMNKMRADSPADLQKQNEDKTNVPAINITLLDPRLQPSQLDKPKEKEVN